MKAIDFNKVKQSPATKDILFSLLAILLAMVIGSIVISLMGESPIRAYGALINGSLGSPRDIANTLSKSIPLLFTGLAVAIGFKGGTFNIGAEGQLTLGAMFAVLIGLFLGELPKIILIPLMFIGGIIGGAIAGAIPGFFKSKFKISEVIVGIMLNYLIKHFTSFLVNGPLKAPGTVAQTEMLSENGQLTKLLPRTQLTTALFIGIAAVVLIYLFLWKTSFGFKIRAVGENVGSAIAAGIKGNRMMIFSMAIGGAIASLAGITEVMGKQYRFIEGFSPSYGFTGIAVAVLGRNHPFGVVLSALLFGILDNGSLRMSRETAISSSIIVVIQSLVILFVSAPELIKIFNRKKVTK